MNQNNNKQGESCPLCETTKKVLNMLKPDKDSEIKDKKSSRRIKMAFGFLIIILGLIGGYKILTKENNLIQGQSINGQISSLAPDFASEDVFGNKVALSNFRGKKPVLLVFWATWCGQCAKELPDLKTFAGKYEDMIQVLAVDSGEPKETIKDYIQEKKINFLILLDEERKIWNQYLIRGTPSHFLIDKEGKIITLRPGLALLKDLEMMMTMIK